MLTNITLIVMDVDRARAFYGRVFGLPESGQSAPGMALLTAGPGLTLLLQPPGAVQASAVPGGSELGFEVDDLEETRRLLQDLGAEVSQTVQMGWGSGFDARDPDGHALSIFRKNAG